MSGALLVLCGGAAKRMGGIVKPLLRFSSGKTALEAIAGELSPLVSSTFYLASDRTAEAIRAAVGSCLIDPGLGPAAALISAAKMVDADWILLAGGDQVWMRKEAVERLFDPSRNVSVASLDGVRQPMPGWYRTAALRALEGEFSGASLQAVLSALGAQPVDAAAWPEPLRRAFSSVNTWDDARASGLILEACAPQE